MRITTTPGVDHRPGEQGTERAPERPARTLPPQPAALLALQRSAGNHAVAQLMRLRDVPWDPDPDRCRPWPIGGPDRDPGEGAEPEPTVEEEWATLQPIHHLFEVGTLESYTALRPHLLAHFGLDPDGARVALQRMLAYYTKVRPLVFQGTSIFVHDDLAERLLIAESALGDRYDLTVGGGNIRFVRGSDTVISDHSWGAAVDLNAATSPMIRGIGPGSERARVIEAITGVDVNETRDGDPMSTKRRTSEELRAEAERLEQASLDLVAAFADEDALAAAAHRIAGERGAPTGGERELLELVFSAGTGKGNEAARRSLTAFVFPVQGDREQCREWDPEVVEGTIDVLVAMGRWYGLKLDRDGDVRAPSAAFPDSGQLAAHGFMSVPPEVVAAMGGSDQADLRWLGAQSGGKDYMHFELRTRPARY